MGVSGRSFHKEHCPKGEGSTPTALSDWAPREQGDRPVRAGTTGGVFSLRRDTPAPA